MENSKLTVDDISIELALKKIKEAIDGDPDYRHAYVSNIAMAFMDEYSNRRGFKSSETKNTKIDLLAVHKISNNAAERFLDNWLS